MSENNQAQTIPPKQGGFTRKPKPISKDKMETDAPQQTQTKPPKSGSFTRKIKK
jgi:hypothetical protein